MTGSDRGRRLAREQYERRQQRRAEAAARARRRGVVLGAVVAAALVVGALVLTSVLDDDEGSSTAAPPAAAAGLDCAEAPSPVASPQSFPSAPAPDPQGPTRATISTTCGDLEVELLPEAAPATVASFAQLSEQGFYDATPCHRLTTSGIYVLQCGDPTGTGTGGPGYSVPLENAPADEAYPAGTLAMARSADPDSGGSQFFVVYEDTRPPAPGYTVFGRVTGGLDVLEALAAAGSDESNGPGDGRPAQPVGISAVAVS
ncbi:peptidylprolyl isomerase [Vallicoccus soli]|uniref:Peptidyl-prolyl cis-trans isomerase n=1 Tax=Vallicoccus soli TaxID=2339232 RepID=A0A3A3Z4Y6_9ACTN|nr:peptidylprolyl isomerase [Vallicoccus soli]RJK96788.1 peptidylprolyl isomerase [Vallicoccus soli]